MLWWKYFGFPWMFLRVWTCFLTFFRSFSDLPCSTLFEWWARRVHLWERCCNLLPQPSTHLDHSGICHKILCFMLSSWCGFVWKFPGKHRNTLWSAGGSSFSQVNLPHFRGKVMHHFKTQHVCSATTMFCRGAGTVLTADQAAMVGDTVKRVEVMW